MNVSQNEIWCTGVSHPYHCGDATFVLMLHINDDAFDDIEHTSQVFVTEIYTYIYIQGSFAH